MSATDLHWRVGAGLPRQILILEPLFEEANRTRQMIAAMVRRLETQGVGTMIVTLPGTGESLIEIESVTFADWQSALAQIASQTDLAMVCSMRGGALLDQWTGSRPRWRFAPETGARVVRDLRRTKSAGTSALYAGHALSEAFLDELEALTLADVSPLRTVRLSTDAAPCDALVDGTPLWRRAEPGDDPALSATLADDILGWMNTCAAS